MVLHDSSAYECSVYPFPTELQSNLLRLSILIATSLSTLLEPVAPTIVADPSGSTSVHDDDESHKRLTEQILNDLRQIFTAVQQSCTNLTLALRPSSKAQAAAADNAPPSYGSPVAGLDKPSIEAANAQLSAIANDHVPKLVFLARKAQSEATLHRYVPKTEEDVEQEAEELQLVKARGGHVVRPAFARDTEKLEKIKGKGLGKNWSKAIVSCVFELLDALGEVSKAYMDQRTRLVLQKASAAREKAEGITSTSQKVDGRPAPTSVDEARQRALQVTGVVWGVCDAALKGKEKLIVNNREATRLAWRTRTGVLKDALREFDDSTKLDETVEGKAEDKAEEPLDDFGDLSLSKEQKQQAKQYLPLLRAACLVHAKVAELYLSSKGDDTDPDVDYDDLDEAGERIAEALDDLVSSILYGDTFDDGEEEQDDEEDVGEAIEELVEATKGLCRATEGDAGRSMHVQLAEALGLTERAAADIGVQ